MDELEFDGKTYVSSKRAAQITGYAKDYVGQLCREGRVEARLVGRNWYVLENSIREHRFGPPTPEKVAKDENGNWQSPRYVSETISGLPTFESHAPSFENAPETEPAGIPAGVLDHSNTIQEMQNAWQDWFSQRNQPNLREELIESPEIIDTREEKAGESSYQEPKIQPQDSEEVVHVVKMIPEPTSEPIKEDVTEEPEEIVPIHRSYYASTPPMPATSVARAYQPVYTAQEPVYAAPLPEGRIVRERRVQKKKRPSVALQALFLSIAGIAIAIALIGSGEIATFLNQNRLQYAPVNFLGGESVVNNASR